MFVRSTYVAVCTCFIASDCCVKFHTGIYHMVLTCFPSQWTLRLLPTLATADIAAANIPGCCSPCKLQRLPQNVHPGVGLLEHRAGIHRLRLSKYCHMVSGMAVPFIHLPAMSQGSHLAPTLSDTWYCPED